MPRITFINPLNYTPSSVKLIYDRPHNPDHYFVHDFDPIGNSFQCCLICNENIPDPKKIHKATIYYLNADTPSRDDVISTIL